MPTGRLLFIGLLGAVAALMSAMVTSRGVDMQATSAIPAPVLDAGKDKATDALAPADVSQLKTGLDALAANNIPGARTVRDALPANSLD